MIYELNPSWIEKHKPKFKKSRVWQDATILFVLVRGYLPNFHSN